MIVHPPAIDVVDALRDRTDGTIEAELHRLGQRAKLSADSERVVAETLTRLAQLLVLDPVTTWQGDPRVLVELFVVPTPSDA